MALNHRSVAAAMLWRRLDTPGHDACRLEREGSGWRLEGAAAFLHEGRPAQLAYRVACDSAWHTREGRVLGWVGADSLEFTIARTKAGTWTLNGTVVPNLGHCMDLDFGFTPATNLIQIRRLSLDEGQAADAPAAWLGVPAGTLAHLPQRYERRAEGVYWYEAPSTGYAALLKSRLPDLFGGIRVYGRRSVGKDFGFSPTASILSAPQAFPLANEPLCAKRENMKDTLRPGIEHEFTFTITKAKTVPALYPESDEFRAMPEVFATGYMVGLIEWTCIQAINPFLDWPEEQSVGTHIDVSHIAATPPGLEVTAKVRLKEVDGRRLVFEVEAHDGIDLIARGRHERFVINKEKFDRKMTSKVKGKSKKSPLDVAGIKTRGATKDILEAVRQSGERVAERAQD